MPQITLLLPDAMTSLTHPTISCLYGVFVQGIQTRPNVVATETLSDSGAEIGGGCHRVTYNHFDSRDCAAEECRQQINHTKSSQPNKASQAALSVET